MKNKYIPFLRKEINDDLREQYKEMKMSDKFPIGYANGYVAVPKSHPWYGKTYEEVSHKVNIHGGLTFSGKVEEGADLIMLSDDVLPDDHWAFGFDTLHYGDSLINCNEQFCKEETLRLKTQLETLEQGI